MQLSDSITSAERVFQRLGYPARVNRRDLWTKPRAALGVPDSDSNFIEVVHWEGFPRVVVAWGLEPEDVIAYATGPAFRHPPPFVLVFDDSGKAKVFQWAESRFMAIARVPNWKDDTRTASRKCFSGAGQTSRQSDSRG